MNREIWRKPLKASDVGGEALIEGVMMRGNGKMAVAMRMSDGSIDLEITEYVPATKRNRWFRTPFVRGAVSMVESMLVGVRVLLSSAEKLENMPEPPKMLEPAIAAEPADLIAPVIAAGPTGMIDPAMTAEPVITLEMNESGKPVVADEPIQSAGPAKPIIQPEVQEDKFDRFMRKVLGKNYFQYMLYFSVAIALVLGVGLFMLLPNFLTDLLKFSKSGAKGSFLANLVEGGMRLILFISYIWLVSRNKEIRRVFQYHGAEHKSIYTLENMEPLTVEYARKHTTLHPRCGTTFLFVVMLISIVVFMFAGWHSRIVNLMLRLVLLPLIAGISYEVFKLAAKTDFKPLRALSMPGLMLQKITTQEPDDDMLEVALTALRAVVGSEASRMPVQDASTSKEADTVETI